MIVCQKNTFFSRLLSKEHVFVEHANICGARVHAHACSSSIVRLSALIRREGVGGDKTPVLYLLTPLAAILFS